MKLSTNRVVGIIAVVLAIVAAVALGQMRKEHFLSKSPTELLEVEYRQWICAEAKLLEVGETVKLRFIKGDRRDLEVTVRSLSKEEGGRVAAVFSSRQYLSELTLLRRQSADIILDTIDGIRIPSTAIRVAEDGTTGLYCVVGMRARFKPVTVVYTAESGYALVQPAPAADGRELLRPCDQVIINAKNLYEGKIVG